MSRPPNYEFREWWNKQRENHHDLFLDKSENPSWLTVEIRSPTADGAVDKERARQLSWLRLLRFQQIANSFAHLTNGFVSLPRIAKRRITASGTPTDSSSSRLYRAIKAFLVVVLVLLVFELVAYFKGWHFSPPTMGSADVVDFVELVYANWLQIRAKYLAPGLQILTIVCVILFLIQSLDRVILVLGRFWIKFRRLKPVAEMEYPADSENVNADDYPMVLVQIPMCNEREVAESEDDPSTKRSKSTEGNGSKNGSVKAEDETKGTANGPSDQDQKQSKANPKPPEPPKDYIHVRARRGHATDSHSLAERVRRDKISERMKLLQDLVPGCNKVTGKALLLDEIIKYVQSLQRQVEVFQPNGSLPNSIYPMDSSVSPFLGPQTQEIPQAQTNLFNGALTHCSVDPLDAALCRNPGMELPLVDGFGQGLQQFPTLCEDEETKGTANGPSAQDQKQSKANPKPPEPPKDYIHVRARRGQATDSHSLTERVFGQVRREKISERMKLLQDLVPGCNKVTGKAHVLDEIINYVQSLQRQVEFLSMKLGTVNPRLDINSGNLLSKYVFQPDGSLPNSIYPMDSSVSPFLGPQAQEIPQAQTNLFNGAVTHCSVDPLDAALCRNPGMELPLVDEFGQGLQQFPTLCEDEETKGTANGPSAQDQKQSKANPKPPEPPKDYIHVRARRGQATDSHSLAERVRREKISERMKRLQDLVPGCNKVTGKAHVLDEIINYVQSLQRQVEFLSMKLGTVNPRLDINSGNLLSKYVFQPDGSLPNSIYPMDSSVSPFLGPQAQEIPQAQTNLFNGAVTHCSVDPLDAALCRNPGMELPLVDEFGQGLQQFPTLCENDLQSIVQMGFGQNPNQNTEFHSQSFPGSSQPSNMKVEL